MGAFLQVWNLLMYVREHICLCGRHVEWQRDTRVWVTARRSACSISQISARWRARMLPSVFVCVASEGSGELPITAHPGTDPPQTSSRAPLSATWPQTCQTHTPLSTAGGARYRTRWPTARIPTHPHRLVRTAEPTLDGEKPVRSSNSLSALH